jgi:hypothetical protein
VAKESGCEILAGGRCLGKGTKGIFILSRVLSVAVKKSVRRLIVIH